MVRTLSSRRKLFRQKRFRYILAVLAVISVLIGVLIVPIERRVGTIDSVFEGMWWAVTTVTTVGYGDYVPVTDLGRVLGIILQIAGAMMFGIIVAMISNYISRVQDEFYWNRLFERLDRLENATESLKRRTGYIVRNDADDVDDTTKNV